MRLIHGSAQLVAAAMALAVLLFAAPAGAVIGGASLSGAKGRAIGAVLGAVIMGLLANGGNLLGIDPFYLQIAIGLLIIMAVYFDHLQGGTIKFLRFAK